MAVVIETTLGDITVDLYIDQRPITCLNFLKLCKMKYYNFNLFHTIRNGFIAQTGDPSGEGSGGESIWGLLEGSEKRFFAGEKMPKIRHTDAGLLSMVCTGDMMVGSQFFFTLAPDLDSLDGVHCVIGEVTEGLDILRKLNDVICDETYRPYQDVRITHTVVLEDPFNDPAGFRTPSRSPSPSAERLKGGRIAPDEEIDETHGKSAAEIQEIIEEKEAKARATILEIVGDLPDADIAPPENVLFICKLNPVTTDEDLEIIFSRFGKIVSCEVIRDKKTGDSLQYAFIEFADKKSCEDAYFKMDNVLIDDRRIHVDFSQSVSRIKWLGKGRGVKHFNDDDDGSKNNGNNKVKRSQSMDRDKVTDRDHHRNRSQHNSNKNKHSENEKHHSTRNRSEKESRNQRLQRERSRSRDKLETSRFKLSKSLRKHSSHDENLEDSEYNHKYSYKRHRSDKNSKDNSNYNKSKSNPSPTRSDKLESTQSHRKNKNHNSYSDQQEFKEEHNRNKKYNDRHSIKNDKSNKTEFDNNKIKHKQSSDKSHSHKGNTRAKYVSKSTEAQTPSPVLDTKRSKTASKDRGRDIKVLKKSKNTKKKRKPSTSSSDSDSSDSSSSSSESSNSSDTDEKKKSVRRKKRKHSSSSSETSRSSSSSSTSSDSSTATSSSSSDSEPNMKKRHKKNSKTKIVKKYKKK